MTTIAIPTPYIYSPSAPRETPYSLFCLISRLQRWYSIPITVVPRREGEISRFIIEVDGADIVPQSNTNSIRSLPFSQSMISSDGGTSGGRETREDGILVLAGTENSLSLPSVEKVNQVLLEERVREILKQPQRCLLFDPRIESIDVGYPYPWVLRMIQYLDIPQVYQPVIEEDGTITANLYPGLSDYSSGDENYMAIFNHLSQQLRQQLGSWWITGTVECRDTIARSWRLEPLVIVSEEYIADTMLLDGSVFSGNTRKDVDGSVFSGGFGLSSETSVPHATRKDLDLPFTDVTTIDNADRITASYGLYQLRKELPTIVTIHQPTLVLLKYLHQGEVWLSVPDAALFSFLKQIEGKYSISTSGAFQRPTISIPEQHLVWYPDQDQGEVAQLDIWERLQLLEAAVHQAMQHTGMITKVDAIDMNAAIYQQLQDIPEDRIVVTDKFILISSERV